MLGKNTETIFSCAHLQKIIAPSKTAMTANNAKMPISTQLKGCVVPGPDCPVTVAVGYCVDVVSVGLVVWFGMGEVGLRVGNWRIGRCSLGVW